MKIKKGDTIKVLLGKDKGRTGKVQKIFLKEKKVLVEGINIYKKHLKPQKEGQKGGIIELSRPLLLSKVILVCPACGKTTRVGYQIDKSEKKYRICKRCQGLIDG